VENLPVRHYHGAVRFGQLVMFGSLVAIGSAASFGACLREGARPGETPSALPLHDHDGGLALDGAPRARADADAAEPRPLDLNGEGATDAAIVNVPQLDAGRGEPTVIATPGASCRASLVVLAGPPKEGVVFNNAMTSADAGYVDRTALVLDALDQQTARIGCCLEPGADGDLAATGSMLVVIELGPTGAVTRAVVDEARSSPMPAGIAGCVAAVVREVPFPRSPADRATVVEYPLAWRRPAD
jgi:hypothetical protein